MISLLSHFQFIIGNEKGNAPLYVLYFICIFLLLSLVVIYWLAFSLISQRTCSRPTYTFDAFWWWHRYNRSVCSPKWHAIFKSGKTNQVSILKLCSVSALESRSFLSTLRSFLWIRTENRFSFKICLFLLREPKFQKNKKKGPRIRLGAGGLCIYPHNSTKVSFEPFTSRFAGAEK